MTGSEVIFEHIPIIDDGRITDDFRIDSIILMSSNMICQRTLIYETCIANVAEIPGPTPMRPHMVVERAHGPQAAVADAAAVGLVGRHVVLLRAVLPELVLRVEYLRTCAALDHGIAFVHFLHMGCSLTGMIELLITIVAAVFGLHVVLAYHVVQPLRERLEPVAAVAALVGFLPVLVELVRRVRVVRIERLITEVADERAHPVRLLVALQRLLVDELLPALEADAVGEVDAHVLHQQLLEGEALVADVARGLPFAQLVRLRHECVLHHQTAFRQFPLICWT